MTAQDDRRAGLRPPQFGVTTLLMVFASLGGVFAVAKYLGPYGAFAAILLVLVVFAHVAGNAIGTKLKENGDRPLDGSTALRAPRKTVTQADYAPVSRLGQRRSLGIPLITGTVLGIVAGSLLALSMFRIGIWPDASLSNMLAGIAALGGLGGIWSFLAVGFLQVTIGAWLQATRHSSRSVDK